MKLVTWMDDASITSTQMLHGEKSRWLARVNSLKALTILVKVVLRHFHRYCYESSPL
jgi:hypothetical protein